MSPVEAGKVYLEGLHKQSPERIPEKLREFHKKMQEYFTTLLNSHNLDKEYQYQPLPQGYQPVFQSKEHLFKTVKQLSHELGGDELTDQEQVEAYFEALIMKSTNYTKIKFFKLTASIRQCEDAIFRFNELANKIENKSLPDPFAL